MSSRNWCFRSRLSEYTSDNIVRVSWPLHTHYAVWCVKRTDDGFVLDGYVEFNQNVKTPKRLIHGADFTIRQVSREDARSSCLHCSSETLVAGPWEHGTWDDLRRPGRRLGASSSVHVCDSTSRSIEDLVMKMVDERLKQQHASQDVVSMLRTLNDNIQGMMEKQCQQYHHPIINQYVTTTHNHNHNITNNVINGNVTSNTTNNNILINDIGNEDLTDFPEERLKELVMQQRTGFLTFVKETRFNPNRPENRNIRIVSKKQNLAAIKKDGEWKQASIAQSLEVALDKSKSQFFKPLADEEYMRYLIDKEQQTVDWCQKMMAKSRSEWWPIKSTVRSELERVYKREAEDQMECGIITTLE